MVIDLHDLDMSESNDLIIKKHRRSQTVKRALDLIASVPLFIIATPFIGLACVAIRAESTGNPIYKQQRYGYKGKEFTAYKLRTMYDHSSDGNLAAPKAGDARVTKVGKFLRKTSIDELPQLLNVVRGDMSILGPRAVPKKEIELRINKMMEHDSSKEALYNRAMEIRMLTKPGISGMAQAYGRSSLTVEQATAFDVYYVLNYSIGLDFKVFFKTIDTVLFQRGVN